LLLFLAIFPKIHFLIRFGLEVNKEDSLR